jgi:two-component system phosphate regulon sensor histidine kinase PhoR
LFLVRGVTSQILEPFDSIAQKLRRLSDGEYTPNSAPKSYDEIDRITKNIDDIALVLQNSFTENRENAKRREEFYENASHELKTPLTAIRGFNELTALNSKDESIRKYINGIARETDRLMLIISDMLKLSELESLKLAEVSPASLGNIISEVRETVSSALAQKSIVFETEGHGTIMADPKHIYELVKNLVENAIRYNNPKGKVTVTIENNDNTVRLTVSDNGIGISTAEQKRIFERFYRVEKNRTTSGGGTGLGLAIVKQICALYDWKLSLKSELGVGTDVIVEFSNGKYPLQ